MRSCRGRAIPRGSSLGSVVRRVWLGVGAVLALGAWLERAPRRAAVGQLVDRPRPVVQGTLLKVADFPAAVAAVEAARGGPQQLVEVNATPDGVNVFVAADAGHEVAVLLRGRHAAGARRSRHRISSAPFDRTRHRPSLGAPALVAAHAAAVPRGHRGERRPRPAARRWAALGLALPVVPRRPAQRALHAHLVSWSSVAPAQGPAG